MGEMRDSDWSRQNLLRSDWLGPIVATITTAEPFHIIHYRENPQTPLPASYGIRYGNLKIAH